MATTGRAKASQNCADRATAGAPSRTRVLGVDYGRKRIGLALSDALRVTARPLAVINRVNRRQDLRRLGEICREHDVARIVMGYPLHIGGEEGEMASEARRFAVRLQKEFGIEVELLDERLTSWEAQQSIRESAVAARRIRAGLDGVAAAVLLREYLERSPAHQHKRQSQEIR
jgi:putative holliday junction resolvase